jgi:hypothetical protein
MNMMSNVNHWGGSVYTNQPIMANDINMYWLIKLIKIIRCPFFVFLF